MTTTDGPTAANQPSPLWIALAGALSLAVAMGVGRFAFTPILPMMLHDGVVDLAGGSWLATANYIGYLAGALLCMALPFLLRLFRLPALPGSVLLRTGLLATVALTLGMAGQVPALWPVLRLLAGIASAVVFVFTSGWCLSTLARRGVPQLGALIYTGPGVGIAVSGLAASGMVALHWRAAAAWGVFGLLAAILTVVVWRTFRGGDLVQPRAPAVRDAARTAPRSRLEVALLTAAYGLAGFGYIITATFLPVIAREAMPGSVWLDLFWPIFGVGVMAGALLSGRVPAQVDPRLALVGCYVIQAVGVMAALWAPNLAGFAIGSALVGMPLTAISFFAMQEARRLRPEAAASFMGLMTAVYGVGQIAGPPFVALLLGGGRSHAAGFALSLETAAATLVIGAGLYLYLAFRHPRPS